MPVNPLTCTGTRTNGTSVPLPSWRFRLPPHVHTVPSARMAAAVWSPALIAVTPVRSRTGAGSQVS